MHTHRCTYTHLRPPLPSLGGIVTTENPFYSPCTALQQHPNCSCSVPSLSTQQSNQNPPLPPSLSLLISSLLLSPASQASPATPSVRSGHFYPAEALTTLPITTCNVLLTPEIHLPLNEILPALQQTKALQTPSTGIAAFLHML